MQRRGSSGHAYTAIHADSPQQESWLRPEAESEDIGQRAFPMSIIHLHRAPLGRVLV
jgi:hypothetical protein